MGEHSSDDKRYIYNNGCVVEIAVREKLTPFFEAIIKDHKAEVVDKKYEKHSEHGMVADYTLKLKTIYDLYTIGKELGYCEKMDDDAKSN